MNLSVSLVLIFFAMCNVLNCHSFKMLKQTSKASSRIIKLYDKKHIAVIGGGPSGLLLAHRLLSRKEFFFVSIFERRPDPRSDHLERRAYALGIGRRGRTAIRSVDNNLWEAVKSRGYESERFKLYIANFSIKLRDGDGGASGAEPSVLMYQSDLCDALLDDLESRYNASEFSIQFDSKVVGCDLKTMTLSASTSNSSSEFSTLQGPFDMIIGCDGVNSVVRDAIKSVLPSFEYTKTILPGAYKVCRLNKMPEKIDPSSVSLVLPKSGSVGAFLEPTVYGPCILFSGPKPSSDSGSVNDVSILAMTSVPETAQALEKTFPLFAGADFISMAEQLCSSNLGSAASIVCNTYHYGGSAALVGDAAHATGGVSGQGVNSALYDSMVLADCLSEYNISKEALLAYSKRQVPEGKALYDLSFGPKPKGLLALRYRIRNIVDSVFRGRLGIGRLPLQTLLTTTLVPFSEVRRQRDKYYDAPFPTQKEFDEQIEKLSLTVHPNDLAL